MHRKRVYSWKLNFYEYFTPKLLDVGSHLILNEIVRVFLFQYHILKPI
nr:MAG TPA: hypothetical protein [Caudoviricetes sp.]DAR17725.1 MAG TPA: hypothetical protein [Caudoviricetes sp.]